MAVIAVFPLLLFRDTAADFWCGVDGVDGEPYEAFSPSDEDVRWLAGNFLFPRMKAVALLNDASML